MEGCSLTKEQEDQVLKEIGYSRAQLARDIPSLRLWLKEQTHLPATRLNETDTFLSNYLVGCKGSIETAKRKLDLYYSLRGKSEIFMNRDTLEYVESSSKHSAIVELPKPTSENNPVWLARLLDTNVEIYNGSDALKTSLLLFEHRLRLGTGILGQFYYVLDASHYTLSHLMTMTPANIRSFMTFFQEAMPLRVKKILVVNAPAVLAASINGLVVPFLNKKIKDRFLITSEPMEKVFEELELLPSDYEGGKNPSLAEFTAKWKAEMLSLKTLAAQFKEEVDETKRPLLNAGIKDPYFGLHGSIKSLVLD